MSTPWIGAPSSSASVAGAGSGSRPCAASTKPRPTGSGEQTTRSMPSDSSASATPHDLADRVDRADLVEVHLLGRDAVDAALGEREPLERLLRARRRARSGRSGGVDLLADRRPVPMRLARRAAHASRVVAEIPCRSRLADARCAARRRPGPRASSHRVVRARVEQRAQQHVARDAADAVDVEDAGVTAPPAARAIRAAIVPAPKPSSMFTTATPAAHEVSIASSALTPPKVAP